MNLRQRIRLYQQLAVLTRAGVPMRTGLQRLHERIRGRAMTVLTQKIAEGAPVGDAFAAAGFSSFECHLVSAGERSAQLDTVFQHLADFWARQRQMFQALTSQLYYPLIILVLSLLVGGLIDFIMNSWMVAVIHLIESTACYGAGAFVLYTLLRVSWRSDAAQRFWLALPIIGSTLSTAYAHRWITVLKLEHGAGVPMPDAVADAWRASGYVARGPLRGGGTGWPCARARSFPRWCRNGGSCRATGSTSSRRAKFRARWKRRSLTSRGNRSGRGALPKNG